jgi:hypothetical protein
MANEIDINAPTNEPMKYEVKDKDGGLVGQANNPSAAARLAAAAKDAIGDGITVEPIKKKK